MWYFTDEEKQLVEVCRDFAKKELAPFAEKHDHEETFNTILTNFFYEISGG